MLKIPVCLIILVFSTSASTPIAAGRWQVTIQMEEASFNGQRDNGPFPSSKLSATCLTSNAAARGPGLAFTDDELCEVLSSTVADGAFTYETKCKATESNDTIVTKTSGSYTADSYMGTSLSVQRRDGMQTEMRSRMEAKRVGSC